MYPNNKMSIKIINPIQIALLNTLFDKVNKTLFSESLKSCGIKIK